jgi:hypothetical protein
MSDLSTRAMVEAYGRGLQVSDIDAVLTTLHEDFTDDYPQSGERIRGADGIRALMEGYPGGIPQTVAIDHIIGAEDTWVVSPSWTPMRIEGSGDQYTSVARVVYPDGNTWYLIQLIRLKDGRIHRVVSYYAAPFEAPAWRASFVERIPTEDSTP